MLTLFRVINLNLLTEYETNNSNYEGQPCIWIGWGSPWNAQAGLAPANTYHRRKGSHRTQATLLASNVTVIKKHPLWRQYCKITDITVNFAVNLWCGSLIVSKCHHSESGANYAGKVFSIVCYKRNTTLSISGSNASDHIFFHQWSTFGAFNSWVSVHWGQGTAMTGTKTFPHMGQVWNSFLSLLGFTDD